MAGVWVVLKYIIAKVARELWQVHGSLWNTSLQKWPESCSRCVGSWELWGKTCTTVNFADIYITP